MGDESLSLPAAATNPYWGLLARTNEGSQLHLSSQSHYEPFRASYLPRLQWPTSLHRLYSLSPSPSPMWSCLDRKASTFPANTGRQPSTIGLVRRVARLTSAGADVVLFIKTVLLPIDHTLFCFNLDQSEASSSPTPGLQSLTYGNLDSRMLRRGMFYTLSISCPCQATSFKVNGGDGSDGTIDPGDEEKLGHTDNKVKKPA
ncbi:hypothetical protein K435DRAFT_863078 [Dendrothele bispora CBS 962.96]|uniref:Uncharacterized protein n=1 Tax=Dendrothele bispora (strain CBS 962.96) TaxID=1314807 RepID=A0A4S8LRA8_DENBC|nr:hypothetical protein K435DRAFT_863078 [Dendrothele bispora CBS 962.96]